MKYLMNNKPIYMKGMTFLFSLIFMFCTVTAFAQPLAISGKVLDEFGEGAIGVNVVEKGTFNGVTTNVDGTYSITVSNPQAVLQFSFVGYRTKEAVVAGQTVIDMTMEVSSVDLQEVVVVGYGTQTRREITGSVTSVSEEQFRVGVTRNATDLLQGKVAGLHIYSGSGSVGSGVTMRLRGISTLRNDRGPFIVIDGVPGGDLNSVAPQDIESISVLKDAAAAAIYGSRSAGGVILITTKRGSAARSQVSYTGYVAVSLLANKPDLMSADQYRAFKKERGQDISAFDRYGASTDWIDEITRTGFSQNHSISLSGGSSKSNYRVSYNYLQNEGILRDDAIERHNFQFQFQQRAINDRLRISLSGAGNIRNRNEHNGYNIVLAYTMLPVFPVKLSDGSWFDSREYDMGNPVRNQQYNQRERQHTVFYGNGELMFTIIDGLDIKTRLYKRRSMEDRSYFNHSETQAGRDNNGWAERRSERSDTDLMEWILEYNKSFGNHKFNALAGYSWEENNWTMGRASNRDFVTNIIGSNSLQSGQGIRPTDVESSRTMSRLISFFGRLNYSFEERYMLTAILRRDGSSKFGADNKWGIFPSVSAAWGLSQEDFMAGATWLDDLKLRVGWGVTGNQDGLDEYRTLQAYGTDRTYYDNGAWRTAYVINRNPNPALKWEQTASFGIGIDFAILNGQLSGTIDWYNRKTSDMLYTYPVPSPPYMFTSMMANVGDMTNTGIEFALNWNVIRNRDFSWNTSVTLDHNKNELTRLSNEQYTMQSIQEGDAWIRGGSSNYTHRIEEGRPVGSFYGWKCEGIDANGRYIFKDLNEDGSITEEDRTWIGEATPKLTYGWNNSFRYKNWDLSFFVRGTIGNKVMNHARMAYAQPSASGNMFNDPLTFQLNEVPKYSSFYVEDGSHLRFDNFVLGYTFNTRNLNWIERARVYVSGQNVFVIHKVNGPDPETDMGRNNGLAPGILDREFYPKAHTYSIGVNLVF